MRADVIETPLLQLPESLQNLLTWERFHLPNVQEFFNPQDDPNFDANFLPQNSSAFTLPRFRIPRKNLLVFRASNEPPDGTEQFCADTSEDALFPIHPLTVSHYARFLSEVDARDVTLEPPVMLAVPTSSVRTLLVWSEQAPEKAVFVKTTMMPSELFGDRRVHLNKAGYCVGLTRLINQSQAQLPSDLGYLLESACLVPRPQPDSGVILRRLPREVLEDRLYLAPAFSLLGGAGIRRPLLLTILDRTGMRALEFVEELLCAKYAKLWLRMALCNGLLPEAHGQNLLLALSPTLAPLGRFFYRDFDGLSVDWELRRALGLQQPTGLPCSWKWHETYETMFAGVAYFELAFWKMRVSLYAYLHFVLEALNQAMRRWSRTGEIDGPVIDNGKLTMMFSRHLITNLEEMFDVRFGPVYNIYDSLNRFLVFVMKLRRDLIAGRATATDAASVATLANLRC